MAAAEALARARGARRVLLDVAAANQRAVRFYRRLGYTELGLLLLKPLVTRDEPDRFDRFTG